MEDDSCGDPELEAVAVITKTLLGLNDEQRRNVLADLNLIFRVMQAQSYLTYPQFFGRGKKSAALASYFLVKGGA